MHQCVVAYVPKRSGTIWNVSKICVFDVKTFHCRPLEKIISAVFHPCGSLHTCVWRIKIPEVIVVCAEAERITTLRRIRPRENFPNKRDIVRVSRSRLTCHPPCMCRRFIHTKTPRAGREKRMRGINFPRRFCTLRTRYYYVWQCRTGCNETSEFNFFHVYKWKNSNRVQNKFITYLVI